MRPSTRRNLRLIALRSRERQLRQLTPRNIPMPDFASERIDTYLNAQDAALESDAEWAERLMARANMLYVVANYDLITKGLIP